MDEFKDADDERIRAAMHDVDVPAGLRDRICNRLHLELEATAAGVVADVDAVQPASQPSGRLRRRLFHLALAVGITGLLVAYYRFSRPMPAERLAIHCDQLLDQLVRPDVVWQEPNQESRGMLAILSRALKPHMPIGFHDLSGRPFSDECRVWELRSYNTNQVFYVLEFQDAVVVDRLTRQLQAVNNPLSGNWSLFAMQTDDRLLVVAFQGPAADFLYPPQSA